MEENESPLNKKQSCHRNNDKNCRYNKRGKAIVWLVLLVVGTLSVLATASYFMS